MTQESPRYLEQRGKLCQEYIHLLDRNRKEHRWTDAKINVMMAMEPGKWYKIRDAPDIYNSMGMARKRGVLPVKDERDILLRPIDRLSFMVDLSPGLRISYHQILSERGLYATVGTAEGRRDKDTSRNLLNLGREVGRIV